MKKCVLILISFTSLSFSLEVYISPRYTIWEEFRDSGAKLLTEKGWLLAVGVSGEGELFMGGMEIYGGTLDYDGRTQAGYPVKTDTDYRGFNFYGGVGWDIGEHLILRPKVLYRLEGWIRDIKSTATAIGYKELWVYHTLDLRGEISYTQGEMRGYTFGTFRVMLSDAMMQTNLEGFPTLYPKKGPAYELGLGAEKGSLRLELSYSFVKFNRSDLEPTAFQGIYVIQPESVRTMLSLVLALKF